MRVYIYSYIDPRTEEHIFENEKRYTGQTSNTPERRLSEHMTESNLVSNTHKNNWLRILKNLNLTPIIHIEEECNEIDADERETYWIAKLREDGHRLTNSTDGGRGCRGYKRSKESIDKQIARMIGKSMSEETKEKIRAKKIGKRLPQRVLDAAIVAIKGKKQSEETKQKRRDAMKKTRAERFWTGNTGGHVSEETRQKRGLGISKARKLKKWNKYGTLPLNNDPTPIERSNDFQTMIKNVP